jgi:S-adenosylmethionine:tRNA-ribosyltransferase-isomerase (queuine synthetase)
MTARAIFPLALPLTAEAIETAVKAFFEELLPLGNFGPLHAAFETLHVGFTADAALICDEVHDDAQDPETAAVVLHTADVLRPLIRVVITSTMRDLGYVVALDEHVSDADLAAHAACVSRPPGMHLEVAAYRRIAYHLFVCHTCRGRLDALVPAAEESA